MNNLNFLFAKHLAEIENEEYKQIVAEALSEKLQIDVDKNSIIEAIEGIDVEAIVKSMIIKLGAELATITSDATEINNNQYSNSISISTLNLPNATSIGSSAMRDCILLASISMPSATSIGANAMYNCISLSGVDMSSATSIGSYALQGCISLVSVNLPNVTSISNGAMRECVSLTNLILSTNQVVTLVHTNALLNTPIAAGTGYIYVPDDLVDSYKTATNWSVFADQIRPMSEFVEE